MILSMVSFFGNMILFIYNSGQAIWNKVKKSRKPGQEQKTLITAPTLFFITITKVLFLEGRLGTTVMGTTPPNFDIFLIFSYF